MSVKQKLVTAEELFEMPDPPGFMLELIDGEVVEMAPAGFEHGDIAGSLYVALRQHVRSLGLGAVLGDNVGYVLRRDPDIVRAPDVSFLARDRMPTGDARQRFVEGAPTVAVEIVSPNDRAGETQRRVQDYLEAGTRQVWVLWPRSRSISIYRAGADTRELGADDMLDGGDVLPGFSVRVGDLFDAG